jgi:CII-binding regulator of phage lambda lysogenization HflD
MMPEVIAIVAVGGSLALLMVGLASLMLVMFQMTNRRIDEMAQQNAQRFVAIENRIDSSDERTSQRFTSLENRFSALEQRQAHLEGVMETIRDMLAPTRAP